MDPAPLDLPRSVHLALWLPHVHGSAAVLVQAVGAVEGDDEPHTVTLADDVPPLTGPAFDRLVASWGAGVAKVAAALPAPGDVAGVPAPVSAAAIEAGECVLVSTPAGSFAAVPEVVAFGSAAETGHLVSWQVSRVPPWSLGVLASAGTLEDAERDLRVALITATDALDALDIASWRPEAAEALTARHATPSHLPPGLDPRRTRVLALAARLLAIIEVATTDDGGAVNLWQADQRSAALRHVDVAARRALCAATYVA